MIRLSRAASWIVASGLLTGAYGCASDATDLVPTLPQDGGKKAPAKDASPPNVVDANAADASADTGAADAASEDASVTDSGITDSGNDSGTVDSGVVDSATVDSGNDSGTVDSGVADSGAVDSGKDSGTVDSGKDSGTVDSGVVDSGKDSAADVAIISCFDSTFMLQLPTQTLAPKAAQGVCTAKQIDDFYTTCFDTNATQLSCDSFIANNATCSDCLSLTSSAKPIAATYPIDDYYVSANVISCGYLQIGKPECALPAINKAICATSSCAYCGDQASYDACLINAQVSGCSSITVSKTCTDAYAAAKTQIDAACLGTNFKATLSKVANYMCSK